MHDVAIHAAFRNGAQTIAALYDLKADPAKSDLFSYEEHGERTPTIDAVDRYKLYKLAWDIVGSLDRPHSHGLFRSGRPKISRK